MKRVLVLVSLMLLLLTAAASAEYKSKITYHEWDANSLSFDLAYVLASGSQIELDVSSAALINGASRKDSERWFFTYSLNREFNWRLGAVYTRSMNLTQGTDGWERDDSQTSLRPLVGI